MSTIPDTLVSAWTVSTPLALVTTADQPATLHALVERFARERIQDTDERGKPNGPARPVPVLQHDLARGLAATNEAAAAVLRQVSSSGPAPDPTFAALAPKPGQNVVEALGLFESAPDRTVLVLLNAQYYMTNPPAVQALCNARELNKQTGRLIVLLSSGLELPPELAPDVLPLTDPLPTEPELRAIVLRSWDDNPQLTRPADVDIVRAVEALAGLAAFPAGQAVALTLATNHYQLDAAPLWARKRAAVEQTKGLVWERGRETFADIGGMPTILEFGGRLMADDAPARPRVAIRLDEIEKMLPNFAGQLDSSGVGKDQLGVILREMEDNEWPGLLCLGPPGSGKSLFSKALANTFHIPGLMMDLGAAKGSLVGQSEAQIRRMMAVIKAMAGEGGALFVATCNRLSAALPAELRRRFRYGMWYFDIPTAAERALIWELQRRKYGLGEDDPLPHDARWTGADIRNVCEIAWRLRLPLVDAARYITPVAVSDWPAIEELRDLATKSKFLSVSAPGPYTAPPDDTFKASPRKIHIPLPAPLPEGFFEGRES